MCLVSLTLRTSYYKVSDRSNNTTSDVSVNGIAYGNIIISELTYDIQCL